MMISGASCVRCYRAELKSQQSQALQWLLGPLGERLRRPVKFGLASIVAACLSKSSLNSVCDLLAATNKSAKRSPVELGFGPDVFLTAIVVRENVPIVGPPSR